VWRGVLQALPVVLGYLPIGFAFGVLAGQGHLSLTATLLMSLIVYAGSSQLIAAGLFASGVPLLSIVFTTFIVNLRHLLMSAALAPYLARWKTRDRMLFAAELTDETFALHSLQFQQEVPSKRQVFATNVTSHLAWILGSWLGHAAGTLLTDVKPYGLDYALPAMFVALLLLQIRDRVMVWVALFAGSLAVLLHLSGGKTWSVILATVIGACFGVVVERWKKK
jgi:4-azaleucine resistance transporter AzlC